MSVFALRHVTGLLTLCICMSGAMSLGAEFSKLIRRVPDSANALVLVDVERIFASDLAKSEGWEGDREERFKAGLTSVPPQATQVVIATQLDLEFMHSLWKFALVESKNPKKLVTVAHALGGSMDKIAGLPAVRLPDDSFIVELSETVRAAMAPANRQQTTRWVGLSNHNLSPYLTEAASFADRKAHVIMAFDTTGAFSADEVARRMGANMDVYQDVLKESPVEPAELAELLSSLRGITLGITFKDRPYGSIKVDFASDITKLEPIAKPLLLAVLAHRGAMIDDFSGWKPEVKGNQFTLYGPLGSSGVMRLSSVIEMPSDAMVLHATNETDAESENTPTTPPTMAEATQDYFQRTEEILKDLRRHKGQGKSIGTYGLWFENYAKKIGRLPMLNVDPEMLEYGITLSGQLRDCSMAIKGIGIKKRPAEIAAGRAAGGGSITAETGGYGGPWGGYNRYGNFNATGSGADYVAARMAGNSAEHSMFMASKNAMRTEHAARIAVSSQLKAEGAATVQQILAQIEANTIKVRADMTQKYQVNF